ncbi:MAG: hypothetical protein AB8H47_26760 [Bacteroidia bacterium]
MNTNRISFVSKCLIVLSLIFANHHLRAQTQNEIGISLFRADIFGLSSNPYLIFQPTVKFTTYSGNVGVRGVISFERIPYDYSSHRANYYYYNRTNTYYTSIGISHNPRLGRFQPYPFVDVGVLLGMHSYSVKSSSLQGISLEKEVGAFISPGYGLQFQLFSNLIIGFEVKGIFHFSRFKQISEEYAYPQNVKTLTATDTSIMYYGLIKLFGTGLTVSKAF